jgi:hypothetical protein
MKNEQIIISVENTKIWWEEKIKEISGLERKAILSEKLRIYMYLEVFTLFISSVTPITVWIPIGAGLFFLAHCVHLDIERKRGMKDKKAFELKINAHIEEWHGIISIFEEIFCENWDTKTVKSFESEYNLRNGLTGSELDDYEKEIKQKLTEYMLYVHETYNTEETFRTQGAYDQMKKLSDEIRCKYNLADDNENCYLHEIVQMYKERIAQWAHT